jgi:hypothetical protein
MSCKYQKHARYQEGRLRYLGQELEAAREEINVFRTGSTSSKITDQDNLSDFWIKPKNPKSRTHRFSADDVSHIQLTNRFSIPKADQQSKGLLKHVDHRVKSLAGKAKSQILLLGSSHWWDIEPMLQESLGTKCDLMNIFKSNAPLTNVDEGLRYLGKDLTKEDHFVIVGGPGKSLDRQYHYSIEKDLNFIAKRTSHTDVRLVNLFRRHNKPQSNRKVGSVNVWLDGAQLGRPTLVSSTPS